MSDAAHGSRAGTQFGRYHLKRLIGRGGMGEVYEAEDTVKERVVALKVLSAALCQDPVFRERLQREARTAGRLLEPHVVPVHDYGEIDGQLFLDMRLIPGTDLSKLLKEHGALSPPRAVAIVRQIASALDAAHAAGVVHRDVKPENILITRDDFAYLVDFGIADAAADENLTQIGSAVGTWKYTAPERFTNSEVSHRADIYSLTCVLHECLTGSPPYRADSAGMLITAHLMEPIPHPSKLQPGVSDNFDEVIARGMAKAPEERYASAGDLAAAAHEALSRPDQRRADVFVENSEEATPPGTDVEPPPPPDTHWPTPEPVSHPPTGGPSGDLRGSRLSPTTTEPVLHRPTGGPAQANGGSGLFSATPGLLPHPPTAGPSHAPGGLESPPPPKPPSPHDPNWTPEVGPARPPSAGGPRDAPSFTPGGGAWPSQFGAPPPTPAPRPMAPRNKNPKLLAGATVSGVVVLVVAIVLLRPSPATPGHEEESTTATTTSVTTKASGPSAAEAQARLIKVLPPGYPPGTCTPITPPKDALAGVSCGLNIDPDGPPSATYALFTDKTALRFAFNRIVQSTAVIDCPGRIQSPGAWHHAPTPTQTAGMLLCGTQRDESTVVWTSDAEVLLNVVKAGPPGPPALEQLFAWWTIHS